MSDEKNIPAASYREVYLDYAAATPMDEAVIAAMLPYLGERFANPAAPYARAREAKAALEDARARLARCIGAKADAITLTAGATEANNLAFACVDGPVVTDAIEHDSVLACAKAREGVIVGVGPDGRVSPAGVAAAITPRTELVSVALANGELGCIQPIREIAEVVVAERGRRLLAGDLTPLYLHTDASQAAGTRAINVASLGVDLLTLSAAKVYGPKQVGLLWAREGVRLRPLVLGGGQEGGVRSGTQDVAGAVAFATALELAQEHRGEEGFRLQALRDQMQRDLLDAFPWARVSGLRDNKRRLPGLLHVSFPCLDARRLVILLERRGVSVGTGSACAASRMVVSHVLEAIGLPHEMAQGSLRITLGRPTTEDDVRYATQAIIDVVRQEQKRLGLTDEELLACVSQRGGGR